MQRARVRVSIVYLEKLLRGEWSQLCGNTTAPDDLQIIGVEQPYHALCAWFYVICESRTFAAIPEGAEIPEVGPFEYTDQRVLVELK